MKLKRFKKNNKRIIMIIIAVVVIVGLVVSTNLIRSHANFSTSKSFNVIQGKIPNPGDVKLAILVGNEKTNTFPNKQDYKYVETKCNEDSHANISFDPNTWKLNIDGIDSKTICTIKFERKTEYEEEILKGSYPVIKDGLVPVTIADNGVVTKADIKEEWYSYANSRWANAVILTIDAPSSLIESNPGTKIEEKYIESYFVWIPKYKYKLFNVEGNSIPEQEIKVEFGTSNTTDTDSSCVATNESGNIGTCSTGKWMTHPAFQSIDDSPDNSKIKGIWVGKFETTGSTSSPTVKPNVASLTNINASTMYNNAYNYKRTLDSHMMKNTEWGAMAYLTNSKYGRPKDESGVPTEIWINNYWNNQQTLTGCTGDSVEAEISTNCANPYGSKEIEKQEKNVYGSTTNNISGIYGTSGGPIDLVMGNLKNIPLNSDFSNWEEINYYDNYINEDESSKILGDATVETESWYKDFHMKPSSSNPWVWRGGYLTGQSGLMGIFAYSSTDGSGQVNLSFRLVLSPTN